ncbi:MAG: 2-oxoacid:ferredoxin oxidoreductase subunit beta [Coriobacteriia bacterium]|nr:2-oxoacid:ferredoxin oxidoreductase subunit beta [Coriobacteriia bacterium]
MPGRKEFETVNRPTWCPGCGNFGIWEAMKRAYEELGLTHEQLVEVWGIGCHGNGADFTRCQGFHGLHGRSLPVATGVALSNPDLTVVVEMGDGDGYGIGMGHFAHSCRRNVDLTVIAHDNQIYGLTTGQASPTTEHLMKTVSTPTGVLEEPVNTVGLAIAEGATFVARGFAGDIPHLTGLIKEAIGHEGFALVDVFQPCVTWNKLNTFAWFRERVYKLDETDHDPADKLRAFELSLSTYHEMGCTPEECRIPIGVLYRETGRPTYGDGLPQLADGPLWKRARVPRDISAAVARLS